MRAYNNGIGEDNKAQNCFTAYLLIAIKNTKIQYIKKRDRTSFYEKLVGIQDQLEYFGVFPDMLDELPVLEQLENDCLANALRKIKMRDRYIFMEKVLADRSLRDIAQEMGLAINTVSTAYHRVVRRLREELLGGKYGV